MEGVKEMVVAGGLMVISRKMIPTVAVLEISQRK